MNSLVLLRVGRDPASFTVNRKAEKIFVHRDEWRTNPSDLNALECALQLGDQGHTVIALAVGGGDEAAVALREARAMGAARAIWVSDPALAEADADQTVAVLQKVVELIGSVDLVLMGEAVLHADLAQVGPRLAEALGWPLIEAASAVAADAVSGKVTAGSSAAGWQVGGPAVVTISPDANQPRYATAGAIIALHAQAEAVERLTAADLGLDHEALRPTLARRGEQYPPERVFGQLSEGSPDELAQRLLAELGKV